MDLEVTYQENGTSHRLSGKKQPKPTGFAHIHSLEQLTQAIRTDLTKVTFAYFYAGWHPDSLSILAELQDISEGYLIDCNLVALDTAEEGNFEVCHKLQIDCVPKGLLISPDLKVVETLDTTDVNATFEAVEKQIILYRQNFEIEKVRASTQLAGLLSAHEAILLVDDDSEITNQHQNAFVSTAAVQEALVAHKLNIPTHAAEGLARWVRVFYGQEKFPQLFVQGKLYGDGQAVINSLKSGELLQKIPLRYVVGDVKAKISSVLAESKYVLILADKDPQPDQHDDTNVGDILTALGLQFREYNLTGSNIELEQHLASRFPGIEYPALFENGNLLHKGKQLAELTKSRSRSKITNSTDGWSKAPLFVAKKAVSASVVVVVGEGPATQRITANIRKTGVAADSLQVVAPNGLVGECLRVLCEGREFPRVFVRAEEVGGEQEVLEMVQDGRFGDLVRPKKGKKRGGCCQGDEPKPSGGCCQDNGSAPKSGGGCCQGSESEEEEDGCCGDKDEDGGCCGGH